MQIVLQANITHQETHCYLVGNNYLYKEKTAQKASDRLTQQFLNLSKKNAAQRSGRINFLHTIL